jgi:hypothetical protein
VSYDADGKDGKGATFASPLIVTIPKGKYQKVVFIEGGKVVATGDVK